MRVRGLCGLLVICLITDSLLWGILFWGNMESVNAAVTVKDEREFKREMEKPGRAVVCLAASFPLHDTVYVRGEKSLKGNGYTVSRFHKGKRVFGGTLLMVTDAELRIHDTILAGEGEDENVRKNTYGRLLDINKGNVILERGATLTGNINRNQNNDGGGAVLVCDGGMLEMKEGKISKNQNVYGGAGIHINRGGTAEIKGGEITENQSWGIAAVEDFDGRGGAISNKGKVSISGGRICRNRVKGYTSAGISYGGVGGMLYNQGECRIRGGTVQENGASYGGGAIYNDRKSVLQIQGGTICENDAGLGEGLFLAGGSCRLGKCITLSSVYLAKGTEISAEGDLSVQSGKIQIIPENYKNGLRVVKTKGKKPVLLDLFSLYGRKPYMLLRRKDGLYLAGEPEKKEAEKTREKHPGKRKYVTGKKKTATKDKTKEDTVKKGKRKVLVKTAPRYFFVWEVSSFTGQKWKEELQKECMVSCRGREKIHWRWRWNGLLQNTAGSYPVEVSVEKGEWTEIPVTLVRESTEDDQTGYVRFHDTDIEKETGVEPEKREAEEVWHFDSQDILKSKEFMRNRKDPFSAETNEEFLHRFQRCRTVRRSQR